MGTKLDWSVTIDDGPLLPIDRHFAAYSPSSHLSEDLYNNKIAFIIALNFPEIPLNQKENLGNDRKAWAYARMGDMFTSRIPSEIRQKRSRIGNDADMYIAAYNIYMGHLLNKKGNKIFPENMVLLSHWNLRDRN